MLKPVLDVLVLLSTAKASFIHASNLRNCSLPPINSSFHRASPPRIANRRKSSRQVRCSRRRLNARLLALCIRRRLVSRHDPVERSRSMPVLRRGSKPTRRRRCASPAFLELARHALRREPRAAGPLPKSARTSIPRRLRRRLRPIRCSFSCPARHGSGCPRGKAASAKSDGASARPQAGSHNFGNPRTLPKPTSCSSHLCPSRSSLLLVHFGSVRFRKLGHRSRSRRPLSGARLSPQEPPIAVEQPCAS